MGDRCFDRGFYSASGRRAHKKGGNTMVIPVILIIAALGLWWVIVPLVHRFGLNITTPGGLIASAFTATVAALLAGGLAASANSL